MTPEEAERVLVRYESNLNADLYKSRWDAEYASKVVPNLIKCLKVDDKLVLLRALIALDLIGPEAREAGMHVLPLLRHNDAHVQINAIYALTAVFYREGQRALDALVEAAKDPALLKDAMYGLIRLGEAAKPTKEVFITASGHKDGRIRRLALRGLREIGAEGPDVNDTALRAAHDKSLQVRTAAAKLSLKLNIQGTHKNK